MPSQSANQTNYRADGHWLQAYLSVYVGALVLEAEIDSPIEVLAPVFDWTITNITSGAAANVKAGYRVMLYSAGGAFKGETRVRYAGTISSTNLPVREHSRGYIFLSAGDIVRVYADVRLSDKLVTADEDFNPDDLAYSDQGENPPPIACSGGAWAGWDTMLPIPFTGSASSWVDPDSNGPLTHSYTFPSGLTADATNVADVNITAADAGEYLVTHVVTDADNSKSTTQYVPVIVHDADNPPYDVVFEAPEWNEESGGSVRVQVFEDAALTAIPDGAFVILWTKERITSTGLKTPGRHHILMTGYIRREEGAFEAETGVETLTFEIISPMARLDELVGYSKVMLSDATPNAWSELKTLTTKRAIIQIIQFYTNLIEAGFDLVFTSNYRNETYAPLFLQEQTPVEQVRELADGTSARFICDRSGYFELHTRPELYAVEDRGDLVTTMVFSLIDLLGWRYTREHWRPVKLLEVRAFSPGTNPQPIFSRWPGLAPGVGNESLTVERVIASTADGSAQLWLNEEAGRRGGSEDGIYVDADGVLQMALDLELDFPLSYWGAFEFYDEYSEFDHTSTLREIPFGDQLYVFAGKTMEYEAEYGTGVVRTRWRTATNGARGSTYVPSQESESGIPPYTPPDLEFPIIAPITEPLPPYMVSGAGTMAAFRTDNVLATTSDFHTPAAAVGPTWVEAALSLSGNLEDAVEDAFSPGRLGTGTNINGMIVTDDDTDAVVYVEDIFGAQTLTVKKASFLSHTNAAGRGRIIEGIFGLEGAFVILSNYFTDATYPGLYYTYTLDGGDTWSTETALEGEYNTTAGANALTGLALSSNNPGVAIFSDFTVSGALGVSEAKFFTLSSNYSVVSSAVASPSGYDPGDVPSYMIHLPFDRNSDDGIVWFTRSVYTGSDVAYELKRKIAGAVDAANYAPVKNSVALVGYSQKSFHSCPMNRARLIYACTNADVTDGGVYVSANEAANWTEIDSTTTYRGAAIAGNDPNVLYVWGTAGAIGYSGDFGATGIDSRKGNMTTGDIVRIVGGLS